MLKKVTTLVLLFSFVFLTGCFTMNHVVGSGASGGSVVQERQWYILWGLVPLNQVDSKTMVGGEPRKKLYSQNSSEPSGRHY